MNRGLLIMSEKMLSDQQQGASKYNDSVVDAVCVTVVIAVVVSMALFWLSGQ